MGPQTSMEEIQPTPNLGVRQFKGVARNSVARDLGKLATDLRRRFATTTISLCLRLTGLKQRRRDPDN